MKSRIRCFALLIGIIVLAAQFHFCADLTSNPNDAYKCPLCIGASSAVITLPQGITIVPTMDRVERWASAGKISAHESRGKSPRAPPYC